MFTMRFIVQWIASEKKKGERHSPLFLVSQFSRRIDCPLLCFTSHGSSFYSGLFVGEFYLFKKPLFHPPTQETTALAVEECVTPDGVVQVMHLHASADFTHWRMTRQSPRLPKNLFGGQIGVGGSGSWGPRACPWGSLYKKKKISPQLIQ